MKVQCPECTVLLGESSMPAHMKIHLQPTDPTQIERLATAETIDRLRAEVTEKESINEQLRSALDRSNRRGNDALAALARVTALCTERILTTPLTIPDQGERTFAKLVRAAAGTTDA